MYRIWGGLFLLHRKKTVHVTPILFEINSNWFLALGKFLALLQAMEQVCRYVSSREAKSKHFTQTFIIFTSS